MRVGLARPGHYRRLRLATVTAAVDVVIQIRGRRLQQMVVGLQRGARPRIYRMRLVRERAACCRLPDRRRRFRLVRRVGQFERQRLAGVQLK